MIAGRTGEEGGRMLTQAKSEEAEEGYGMRT